MNNEEKRIRVLEKDIWKVYNEVNIKIVDICDGDKEVIKLAKELIKLGKQMEKHYEGQFDKYDYED